MLCCWSVSDEKRIAAIAIAIPVVQESDEEVVYMNIAPTQRIIHPKQKPTMSMNFMQKHFPVLCV